MRQPIRIGWIGFHVEGLAALEGVLQQGFPIQCVITLRKDLLGNRSGSVDYEETCRHWNIPLFRIANINDQDSISLLRRLQLDVVFVIGWSQIVRKEALESVSIGMIGAHASLLPRNRGSAPINWALIRGEKETGNSLMWLTEEVDEGDLIDQTSIPISPYDDCSTLYEQVSASNLRMITKVIPSLMNGNRPGVAQPQTDEPILPRRRPEDGQINWANGSEEVYNFVRALTRPYPGAFSWLHQEKWLIWRCSLLPGDEGIGREPGEIVGRIYGTNDEACGLLVSCGKGAIILQEIERTDGFLLKGRCLSEQRWEGSVWGNG